MAGDVYMGVMHTEQAGADWARVALVAVGDILGSYAVGDHDTGVGEKGHAGLSTFPQCELVPGDTVDRWMERP